MSLIQVGEEVAGHALLRDVRHSPHKLLVVRRDPLTADPRHPQLRTPLLRLTPPALAMLVPRALCKV